MKPAQHKEPGTVLIHPTTCNSPQKIIAFQRRTGLHIVVTSTGTAHGVPGLLMGGAA